MYKFVVLWINIEHLQSNFLKHNLTIFVITTVYMREGERERESRANTSAKFQTVKCRESIEPKQIGFKTACMQQFLVFIYGFWHCLLRKHKYLIELAYNIYR